MDIFPEELYVGILPLPKSAESAKVMEHSVESRSGQELLRKLIGDQYKSGDPEFETIKYEKPSARLNGDVVSVSFSHTTDAVCAAISKKWVVGIDMESTERKVSESLAKRMKHPDEILKFYDNNPIIQIWTMKEAALKAIGTGLRKPMNSVSLESVNEKIFKARLFNEVNAEICSFQLNDQWISICYIVSKLTEEYLSEVYVPIQTGRHQKSTGSSSKTK